MSMGTIKKSGTLKKSTGSQTEEKRRALEKSAPKTAPTVPAEPTKEGSSSSKPLIPIFFSGRLIHFCFLQGGLELERMILSRQHLKKFPFELLKGLLHLRVLQV